MQSTTQRPLGITILAVLAGIGGLLGLFGSLAILGVSPIYGILNLVISVAYVAFAYGAWTLQPWAWMIGVVIASVGILISIVGLFFGSNIASVIIGAIIPAIILYYLMTPDVKKAFGQPA